MDNSAVSSQSPWLCNQSPECFSLCKTEILTENSPHTLPPPTVCMGVVWTVPYQATSWTVALPGSPVHGILQARILEWVAISFSRGSSRPRDQIWVSCISRQILGKPQLLATTTQLYVALTLTAVNSSYKWNYTVFFNCPPGLCMFGICQNFLPF